MDTKSKNILGVTQSHLPEDGERHKANLEKVGRLCYDHLFFPYASFLDLPFV